MERQRLRETWQANTCGLPTQAFEEILSPPEEPGQVRVVVRTHHSRQERKFVELIGRIRSSYCL